jgi:hypothetical protein
MGGLFDLASYHCAEPCETTADCDDPTAICVDDFDSEGTPTGKRACHSELCLP